MKLLILLLLATAAYGANTGSLTISGTVPAATNIVVTPQSGFNTLDLTTNSSNLLVATINERNNTAAGYTVTLTSGNNGVLKNASYPGVPYSASYANVSVRLSTTPVTITSQGPQMGVVNSTKDFKITFTGQDPGGLVQGTYSDTLIFTITGN